MVTQDPGIAMPKLPTTEDAVSMLQPQSGDGGAIVPPCSLATTTSGDNDPEQHETSANLVEMTEEELHAFVKKCLSRMRLYSWSPDTGWQEEASWSK